MVETTEVREGVCGYDLRETNKMSRQIFQCEVVTETGCQKPFERENFFFYCMLQCKSPTLNFKYLLF